MSKPGSLLSETAYTKIHASLEVFQSMGVTEEDLERLRSQSHQCLAYQRFVRTALTLFQDLPDWMTAEQKKDYTDISGNPLMDKEEAIEVIEDFLRVVKESPKGDEYWSRSNQVSFPELGAAMKVLLVDDIRIYTLKPFLWGWVTAWKKFFDHDTVVERERTDRAVRRNQRKQQRQQ